MDLRYKLFPYPVLAEFLDDYIDNKFISNAYIEKIRDIIIFKLESKIENKGLQNLIENDKARYMFHIECPQTSYRTVVKTKDQIVYHEVEIGKLVGKVQICTFIVAIDEIYHYTNETFVSDYKGITFNLEKGNILAIGGQFNITVDKEKDELGKIPSIFSILRKTIKEEKDLSVDIDDNKVKIWLPEKEYYNYQKMATAPSLQPVLHSMIVLPVLVYIFEEVKKAGIDGFEEYRWFKSIRKSLEIEKVTLNNDTLNKYTSIALAQKVLNMPLTRALDGLIQGNNEEGEE
ncbi:hypothetical protein [Clostridium algidicarnis]|uniref:hypothetical protein n=1 Tax=Clostridium algidicarnis TaxID=37659 RepID=UPI0016239305|nr:hypothetical protein [Clostridium algidicarnis]MBB6696668.1 hypothetical protein [Clostridium algidicarnis]